MTQIEKFKNVKELISFFECGGEGIEECLLKNEVINSTYSEEVLLDGNPVIAVFDARRYFYDDNKCDVVEDIGGADVSRSAYEIHFLPEVLESGMLDLKVDK